MKLGTFLRENRIELLLILILIFVSAFLRLYRISDYMVFLGDEGRDAIVVKNLIVHHNLPFLGPVTSIGNMYLGPFYYYLMAPFLWLWRLDPTGPAIMVGLLGVATTVLIYHFAREFTSPVNAFLPSLLYAVSPIIVNFSRSSWNPNVVPFFAIVTIYALTKSIISDKKWWLMLVGAGLGILIQLHYLTVLLFPITLTVLLIYGRKINVLYYLSSAVTFVLPLVPFILFNFKHQFLIFHSIIIFVTSSKETNLTRFNPFYTLTEVIRRIFVDFLSGGNGYVAIFLGLIVVIGSYLALEKMAPTLKKKIVVVGLLWFYLGILALSFFHGIIYDYYLAFLFPAPFVLLAVSFDYFKSKRALSALIMAVIFIAVGFSLSKSHLRRPPNRLLSQTKEIAQFVIDKSNGEPYNFALIAGRNADFAYRYFFEIWNKDPTALEQMVTGQLLVVCEDEVCKPLGNPIWEIAGFGQADIEGQWELRGGVKVFKLGHHPGVPNQTGKPAIKGI